MWHFISIIFYITYVNAYQIGPNDMYTSFRERPKFRSEYSFPYPDALTSTGPVKRYNSYHNPLHLYTNNQATVNRAIYGYPGPINTNNYRAYTDYRTDGNNNFSPYADISAIPANTYSESYPTVDTEIKGNAAPTYIEDLDTYLYNSQTSNPSAYTYKNPNAKDTESGYQLLYKNSDYDLVPEFRNRHNQRFRDYQQGSHSGYRRSNNARQGKQKKEKEKKSPYFEEYILVENFGKYLLKRTKLSLVPSSNDSANNQYNALLSVLVALARVIRNSCGDVHEVYHQVYRPTIDAYYNYGLTNADKVPEMIDGFIKKTNLRIPKVRKVIKEICNKETYNCSEAVQERITSAPFFYMRELETLEAISRLGRNYYHLIKDIDRAARKGTMLEFLHTSEELLKEFILNLVNTLEHITNKRVKCV